MDNEATTGALALVLRAATMALRFALPLALIRLLGLEATGLFALIAASAAIAPAALGWGLNNLLTRELVLVPEQAPRLIATRLTITVASTTSALLAAVLILHLIGPIPGLPLAPALLVIALETLALDIHVILIALGRARRANLLLFLRSAVWIPVFLVGAWRFEAWRSLDGLLYAWLAGHILALAALAPLALRATWPKRLDGRWLMRSARNAAWVYAADLGLVCQLYADRYLVVAMLGLEATGVYSVCAALGQSLQILANSAVLQPALPRLIAAAQEPDVWSVHVRPVCIRLALMFAALLSMLTFTLIVVVGHEAFKLTASAAATLCLLSLAAGGRSASDVLNAVLVGQGRHRAYAALSMAGAAFSILFSLLLFPILGLTGAGLAAALAAGAALLGRATATNLFRNHRRR
ncbi:hypothetical protein [Rhizobium sp. FKL33]|uniref:lipopolysaccharide biosynthesis protein n=1 Tax=Rhizobium sp. FKL33 TaxID=2562307 RepID=UPI0010BFE3CD|nr:hypothetical protein [Rhizobium sp. FKL33]